MNTYSLTFFPTNWIYYCLLLLSFVTVFWFMKHALLASLRMYFGLKVCAHVMSILSSDWKYALMMANDTFLRALRAQSTRVVMKFTSVSEGTLNKGVYFEPEVHKKKRVISLLVFGEFYQSLFN